MRRWWTEEEGSAVAEFVMVGALLTVLTLTIFYGFLSLVLILLVVSATLLYLERKRLFTLAVGAEAFELEDVSASASGFRRPSTPRMSLPR